MSEQQEREKEHLRQQIQQLQSQLSQLEQETADEKRQAAGTPQPQSQQLHSGQPRQPYGYSTPPYPQPPYPQTPPSYAAPPYAPPTAPRKKKDWELNLGKNILGILASALIFAGILLLAWASGSKIAQLVAILIAGAFLLTVGILGGREKNRYRNFFLTISGCGSGVLYIGILLAYWYYHLIPVWGMYLAFLAWAGLMALLSRGKPIVFQLAGQVGLLVSILAAPIYVQSISDSAQIGQQIVLLSAYFLIAALFYLLTCRDPQPEKHHAVFLLNCFCVLAWEGKWYLALERAEIRAMDATWFVTLAWKYWSICGGMLIVFLLFQYIWEMRRWLREEKATDRVWLIRFLPTLLLLTGGCFMLAKSSTYVPYSWLQQGFLLLNSVLSVTLWLAAQRKRVATRMYRLAFAFTVLSAAVSILCCDSVVCILAWGLLLLTLAVMGKLQKQPMFLQTAYGMFLFVTWLLLPSLLPDWKESTVLLYGYLYTALLNCGVILYSQVKGGSCLRVLSQIGNGAAIAVSLLLLPVMDTLSTAQTVWMAVTLTAIYTVNSGRYFQGKQENRMEMGFLFSGKHFVLLCLLLHLFRLPSVWNVGCMCLLILGYTVFGFWKKNNGIRLSGWLLLLFTLGTLLLDAFFLDVPDGSSCIRCFLGAATGFAVLFCYHWFGAYSSETLVKLTKKFLVFPAAALLMLGLLFLLKLSVPAGMPAILAAVLGIAAMVSGWIRMQKRQLRNFFTALAGTGYAVLFQSIFLLHGAFSSISSLTMGILFLLWVGIGCLFSQRRADVFQPLTAVGVFLSVCVFSASLCDRAMVGLLKTQFLSLERDTLFVVIYFLAASALLTFSLQRERLRDTVVAMLSHGLSLIPLLLAIKVESECNLSQRLLENGWILAQYGLLLLSVLLQYAGGMLPYLRRMHGSDRVWSICYLPALAELAVLILFGICNSWNAPQDTFRTDLLSMLPAWGGAAVLLGFWCTAQRRRVSSNWYRLHLTLTALLTALVLLLSVVQTVSPLFAWIRAGVWLVFLAVLGWNGLRKHVPLSLQLSQGLFLCGTWITWIELPIFEETSLRQTLSWMVSLFLLWNCGTLLLQYGTKQFRELRQLCVVLNWVMMGWGSVLMLCNFKWSPFSLELPVKILLAAAITLACLISPPRLMQHNGAPNTNGMDLLFSLKYTALLIVLFSGFSLPRLFLSVGFLLLSAALIAFGFRSRRKTIRLYGLILVLVSVCKLLLTDLTYDHPILRAFSFLLCGVLCFVISFIYHYAYTRTEKTTDPQNAPGFRGN